MDEPPASYIDLQIFNAALSTSDSLTILFYLLTISVFVILSAAFSGSENALFSLSKAQLQELIDIPGPRANAINFLLRYPKRLLATILIANTFVNIAIVLISTLLFASVFNFAQYPLLGFFVEVVLVTFMLVLFGEVIPKVYSFQNNVKISRILAVPLFYTYKLFQPLVLLLEKSTSIIDKRITKKGHIFSVDELTHAIEITSEKDAPKQEKNILKSVVNFGNTNVKQIMRQRPDVIGVDIDSEFKNLMTQIIDSGYSRVPVFQDNLDQIKGILFTKDLLPYLNYKENFEWQKLLRPAYFVPESKKIDDLLKEFQTKRMHLAIVVDEFGGTSGLVSMEDIVEEIFGEIQDEFDEDEHVYTRINDYTFVFEGKMLINDMCKYMEIDADDFEEIRNDAETLGGMLLEINAHLPKLGQEIQYNQYTFKIESVDTRRIKRVKVSFEPR
ncbi:MAG: gliding motility-associated protein GldE [Bacteroidia bacterium]|jgi:putative hemolysin|nr:gliding motility-associated protein GldE [Bacteroidia bacterium]